jgi:uncharacterized protein (DUF2252 family)
MSDVVERIHSFNQGRVQERLQLKYQRMAANSFAFFRGTCHLFYEDWPAGSPLDSSPAVWICGDLHLENFGSYKGDNRLAYFDINDFDEGVLAPCTWDLARFLTSIFVAAGTLELRGSEASVLGLQGLEAYSSALSQGRARMVEAETAEGMVKDLLESLKQRKRKEFLDQRTHRTRGRRQLIIDGKHTAVITMEERSKIESFVKTWATQQSEPEFFELLDVAHRIAGTGSLGVDRYVLLVEGKGSPDHNYLLDLKEARTSCLQPYLNISQPHWTTEAERIVAIQKRIQGTSPALLFPVMIDKKAYVVRELQPSEDRVDLKHWQGKLRRLEKVIQTMAEVVSWGQLRSTGRQGSAIADDLIEFCAAPEWRDNLLRYAKEYADQVETDYKKFCFSVGRTIEN